MNFFDILLLALALSVDAFVVSFSYGLIIRQNRGRNAFKLAISTGVGQFLMPVIGWYATRSVHTYIENFDHWLAFAVFLVLGLKIIDEALEKKEENKQLSQKLSLRLLFMIGVATSIDALITGVTIYFMNVSIWTAAPVIGITTFICAVIGFNLNCCFRKIPTKYMEITAGVILILLGCKVLYEHLTA